MAKKVPATTVQADPESGTKEEAQEETTVADPTIEVTTINPAAPATNTPIIDEAAVDAPIVVTVDETLPPDTPEPTTPPVIPDVKPSPVVAKPPNYVAFFEQYLGYVRGRTPDKAIKSFNNCIKSMLLTNDVKAFDDILTLFTANKPMLSLIVVLQSIATLSVAERAVVEIISTIFHLMIENKKAPVNLELARTVVKNDAFINWCAGKLG